MNVRRFNSQTVGEKNPGHAESEARAAIESLAQAAFTDAQWQRVRATLLEYVMLLRDWKAKMTREHSIANKVVTIREATTSKSAIDNAA